MRSFPNSYALIVDTDTDVQPLLRLSHLLAPAPVPGAGNGRLGLTFVYVVDAPLTGAPFAGLLSRARAVCSRYASGSLVPVSTPRRIPLALALAGSSFTVRSSDASSRRRDALQGDDVSRKVWELLFERRVGDHCSLLRVLRVEASPADACRVLSAGGRFLPTVLVTVETGRGPGHNATGRNAAGHNAAESELERFVAHATGPIPRLWVRGALPTRHHPPGSRGRKHSRPQPTPLYPSSVAHFSHWDVHLGCGLPAGTPLNVDPFDAQVIAFSAWDADKAHEIDVIGNQRGADGVSVTTRNSVEPPLSALLVEHSDTADEIPAGAHCVRMVWAELARSQGLSVARVPVMPLGESITVARAQARLLGLRLVVAQAPSYEDELRPLVHALQAQPSDVHVQLVAPGSLRIYGFEPMLTSPRARRAAT